MGNRTKSDSKPTTKKPVKRKPANAVKFDTEKKAKAKAKPRKITNLSQVSPPKPARRRSLKPSYKNILYPKQKDIQNAIIDGMDTRRLFRDNLIKAKLFKEDGEKIFVVLPKPRQRNRGIECENPAQLLDKLVLTLSGYFAFTANFNWEIICRMSLEIIGGMRESFIRVGAPEKSFDDALKKLNRWFDNWKDYRISKLSTKRDILYDLKAYLFNVIKERTNFSDREIFRYIARLYRYFGFDIGTEEQINNCMRNEYYSAGGKEIVKAVRSLMYSPSPFLP